MNNMRRGFTMIELIFVIVIIGILAAVAIPKLNATRDDAKIKSIVANTRTLSEDIKNYYMSQGQAKYVAAKVSDITDVPLFTGKTCTAANNAQALGTVFAGTKLYICDDSKDVLFVNSTKLGKGANTYTMALGSSTSTIAAALKTDKVFRTYTAGTTTGITTTIGGTTIVE